MFHWDVVGQYLFSGLFINAAWTTLWISVVAQASGVVIGLFLALMRMSRLPFVSWPARFYIWLFRGSPLLVQIYILFDGLPQVFPNLTQFLSAYVCVLLALSLNEGAYMGCRTDGGGKIAGNALCISHAAYRAAASGSRDCATTRQ